jgi:hypothetical protein
MAVDANTTAFIEVVGAGATSAASIVTSMIGIFMAPPLNYILVFGIAMGALSRVRRLVMKR